MINVSDESGDDNDDGYTSDLKAGEDDSFAERSGKDSSDDDDDLTKDVEDSSKGEDEEDDVEEDESSEEEELPEEVKELKDK